MIKKLKLIIISQETNQLKNSIIQIYYHMMRKNMIITVIIFLHQENKRKLNQRKEEQPEREVELFRENPR